MNTRKPKLTESVNKITSSAKTDPDRFPIVGIGASAGGLEALEEFFSKMPVDSGMAFVVIQHLDPTHVGIMPELLQRITGMKVMQATDRLIVKPNNVYVIPPNKSLSLLHGALHLFDPVESRGLRLPIDIFFRSLAEDQQENSIGIILSGMGSDGSLGLKAIKEKNGMVLVQTPSTAKFDGMPTSATESVIADIIAPANELPAKLIASLKYTPLVIADSNTDLVKNYLEKIIILLREHTRHDFSLYKKNTLIRRVERRKSVHQIETLKNYVHYLQENPAEVEILFKELLIGVTSFFRDPAVWEMLKEKVLPDFLNELPEGREIRVWIPGCSTGEEAYSLAIVFKEALGKMIDRKNQTMQIFATDIDNDAIDKARKGFFNKNITADVSPERIDRYFNAEKDGYRVASSIREMIIFAPQNVIKDPPFTKLDIISCRNMLIYMEPELQKKVIALFQYSLNPQGLMILGTSESLWGYRDEFKAQDIKLKIFKRTAVNAVPGTVELPGTLLRHKSETGSKMPIVIENVQNLADQVLLQRFSPPSVLVNGKGDIIYITGRTGKYLEPAAGKANLNIYAMAREGLREILPGALRKASQSFDPLKFPEIKIGSDSDSHFVNLTVQRLETPVSLRGLIMIIFNDISGAVLHKSEKKKPSGRQNEKDKELQRCYEELRTAREEMQTSQEELRSANEELQSTNEELQSTNEELTTSKEEMQSLNEELQTVNIELQSKVNNYIHVNDDLNNLLNSTEIATLFIDKEFNIRRFTNQVKNIIKIREADIGRPYTDLVTNLKYPEIDNHTREVIKSLIPIETAITTYDGRWFNVRIMPYRTLDDRIDGLVITFNDITIAKKLEFELRKVNQATANDKKE